MDVLPVELGPNGKQALSGAALPSSFPSWLKSSRRAFPSFFFDSSRQPFPSFPYNLQRREACRSFGPFGSLAQDCTYSMDVLPVELGPNGKQALSGAALPSSFPSWLKSSRRAFPSFFFDSSRQPFPSFPYNLQRREACRSFGPFGSLAQDCTYSMDVLPVELGPNGKQALSGAALPSSFPSWLKSSRRAFPSFFFDSSRQPFPSFPYNLQRREACRSFGPFGSLAQDCTYSMDVLPVELGPNGKQALSGAALPSSFPSWLKSSRRAFPSFFFDSSRQPFPSFPYNLQRREACRSFGPFGSLAQDCTYSMDVLPVELGPNGKQALSGAALPSSFPSWLKSSRRAFPSFFFDSSRQPFPSFPYNLQRREACRSFGPFGSLAQDCTSNTSEMLICSVPQGQQADSRFFISPFIIIKG
ncbi:hypothetical protein B0O80DRAFT_428673 [Mortierella sp. GBAus27b]|nr:hypothetical protein B0O80DRAFT_428673 [Mortierella sp. GBAus27b]